MSDGQEGTTSAWAWPGLVGGLLTDTPDRVESLDDYAAGGGYAWRDVADVLALLAQRPAVMALQGRGGAAFPMWRKLEIVRAEAAKSGRPAVVVANGAEGEPLSVKDRYLMRHRPHVVLDGMALASRVVGASTAYVYVFDDRSVLAMERALADARAARIEMPQVRVVRAQATFVAGEATAAVRAIDTGVARPRDTPPHPSQTGVGGAPTLVSNVETLARLARAVQPLPPARESPVLVTLSGASVASTVVEIPYGLPVVELVERAARGDSAGRVALIGGFFGGMLPISASLRLSVESMAEHSGSLGCGSVLVLDAGVDPLPVASAVAEFYAENNAQQCRTCVQATKEIASVLKRGLGGSANVIPQLARWSDQLPGRGACATPDGIALLLRSLLRHFPKQLTEHIDDSSRKAQVDWRDLVVSVPIPRVESFVHGGGVA